MRAGDNAIPFPFAVGINAHSHWLKLAGRWIEIEPNTPDPTFPERCRLATFDPTSCSCWRGRHQGMLILINNRYKHSAISPFRVCYVPFAADRRRGAGLGRRPVRYVGCHAQAIQLPSSAPLPELGQASLAVALIGSPMASRFASQAPALKAGVLDPIFLPYAGYMAIVPKCETLVEYTISLWLDMKVLEFETKLSSAA
jgi:hypothetical protein